MARPVVLHAPRDGRLRAIVRCRVALGCAMRDAGKLAEGLASF
jgi:hypothetical protein